MSSVAASGVTSFMDYLTTTVTTTKECEILDNQQGFLTLTDMNITNCTNLVINEVNCQTMQVFTCQPGVITKAVTQVITNANNASPTVQAYVESQLAASGVGSKVTVNITENLKEYMDAKCDSFTATSQSIQIPSWTASDCNNDIVNLYQTSDVNVRCAIGVLSALLPGIGAPLPAPPKLGSFFQISKAAVPILAGVGAVGFVLLVALLVLMFTSPKTVAK